MARMNKILASEKCNICSPKTQMIVEKTMYAQNTLKKNISQIIGGVALSAFLLVPAFGAKQLASEQEVKPKNPTLIGAPVSKTIIAPVSQAASDLKCDRCVDTTDIATGAVTLNELADDVFSEFAPTGEAAKLAGITYVALSGGDYSSPLDAMSDLTSWCDTPSSSNQCLIKIAPGTYDLDYDLLRMQEWVSIQGSGQEVTKLSRTGRFAISSANNVALMDLTVEITGDADATAIFNQHASPRIENVDVIASGANGSVGVYNQDSNTIMNNVTATASGSGENNYGVRNISGSSTTMNIVTATASGGVYNKGVEIGESSPIMTNITASASGGTYNYGVTISYDSSPIISNITASASGGTNNYGVGIYRESSPLIKDSILEGDTNGLYIHHDSTDTQVVNSKIIGGVDDENADTQCRGNYDENLADVDC